MKTGVLLLLSIFSITGNTQHPESTRIKEQEQKLDQATRQLERRILERIRDSEIRTCRILRLRIIVRRPDGLGAND
jgi:hypothetical protein